jgi:hypothetical protein
VESDKHHQSNEILLLEKQATELLESMRQMYETTRESMHQHERQQDADRLQMQMHHYCQDQLRQSATHYNQQLHEMEQDDDDHYDELFGEN